MSERVPVVLAGGEGARLWPLSRASRPKPFLPLLVDGRSPFQAALLAASQLGSPVVVCHAEHRFLAAEQARQLGVRATLILEPSHKGDAVAVLAAGLRAPPDATLVVLPAEVPPEDLQGLVARCRASHPERWVTAVRAGSAAVDLVPNRIFRQILEVASGAAGAAIRRAMDGVRVDLDFLRVDEAAWEESPLVELCRLREEGEAAQVEVEVPARTSDLAGLHEASPRDADANALSGDVVALGARGCLARADARLVVLLDVEDLAVLETPDAVLVAPVSAGERVRAVVGALEAAGRSEAREHVRALRPWGSFARIGAGDRWQAKRIVVEPGGALSLQRHQHRAEHWVVVRGRARITRGDEVVELGVDESTYIPRGVVHRLENPGQEPLVVVEVQTGDRLDEEDIERLEDRYGR